MPKRCSAQKDAYWYQPLAGLHSQKKQKFAINEFLSEWKQTLKKYTEYVMNKVHITMRQIKHGN